MAVVYEDVLVVRVHKLVPHSVWSKRYELINYFERELWPQYVEAYEDAMAATSTKRAPWYVIPSNHKWFRNLAVSQIIADSMDEMGLKLPPTRVDLAHMRSKYHAAKLKEKSGRKGRTKEPKKVACTAKSTSRRVM